tara:strand:+ start:389 stop:736 length:348 start_codon:yes stop_codon:yes gene_type:complete
MTEDSHKDQDVSSNNSSSEQDFSAKLTILVDKEGEIVYNCDWEPTDDGLLGVASIFYKLLIDDLGNKIFEEIKNQCVLNNAETDFMAIENIIYKYASIDSKGDSVVVPPDKITSI